MLHSVKRLHKLWAKSYIIQGQGQRTGTIWEGRYGSKV